MKMAKMVQCPDCDGTGDSDEVIEHYAPPTWDDPGYHEFEARPCRRCNGLGRIPNPASPSLPMPRPVVIADDLPF